MWKSAGLGIAGLRAETGGWGGGGVEAVMNEMLIVDGFFFPPSSFGGQAGPPLHTYINT